MNVVAKWYEKSGAWDWLPSIFVELQGEFGTEEKGNSNVEGNWRGSHGRGKATRATTRGACRT